MTDDELKEKVIEKLDLTKVPDALEWIDLQIRIREKAERLGWGPLIYLVPDEPDEKVYYHTILPTGRVLKEEDFHRGLTRTTHYSIQKHGRYQAEALAFLEIFKPAREEGKGS